jgi:hypothetical protein
MSTAQTSLLAICLGLALSQLVAATTIKNFRYIDALNIGRAIILPVVGAGFALLRTKAQVLQNVGSIDKDTVVSGTTRMTTHAVSQFGNRLLIDDFYVLGVVVILLGLIF